MSFVPTEDHFVSLDAVKDYLKLDKVDTAEDTLLMTLIEGISAQIAHYVGRDLVQKTYQETHDGQGQTVLFPIHHPLVAVQDVVVDETRIAFAKNRHETGYRFSETAIYLQGDTFRRGRQNIALTYIAGYRTLPCDITWACLRGIENIFRFKDKVGAISQSLAGQSITWRNQGFDEDMKHLLAPFRRVI